MPSVKKLHLKDPRRFFTLLAVAECWNWSDALHEMGYPDTNIYVYTGRVVQDIKMQFIGSMMGLVIPTNIKGMNIDSMRIEEIKTHNKRMIERVGLKDWRDKFTVSGFEFTTDYDPNGLMDELAERGYAFEDKGFLTPLDYIPQKPVYDEIDIQVAVSDAWLIQALKNVADDPNAKTNDRLTAIDKLAKMVGSYRQNRSAVDEEGDVVPTFIYEYDGTTED